mmetsp:Transcript_19759/g.62860  ORF Transcript_19759/g.62860 Transcript_19759/m.62860 type:complete len:342 (-) Transcript_19759:913-1938(-)
MREGHGAVAFPQVPHHQLDPEGPPPEQHPPAVPAQNHSALHDEKLRGPLAHPANELVRTGHEVGHSHRDVSNEWVRYPAEDALAAVERHVKLHPAVHHGLEGLQQVALARPQHGHVGVHRNLGPERRRDHGEQVVPVLNLVHLPPVLEIVPEPLLQPVRQLALRHEGVKGVHEAKEESLALVHRGDNARARRHRVRVDPPPDDCRDHAVRALVIRDRNHVSVTQRGYGGHRPVQGDDVLAEGANTRLEPRVGLHPVTDLESLDPATVVPGRTIVLGLATVVPESTIDLELGSQLDREAEAACQPVADHQREPDVLAELQERVIHRHGRLELAEDPARPHQP